MKCLYSPVAMSFFRQFRHQMAHLTKQNTGIVMSGYFICSGCGRFQK